MVLEKRKERFNLLVKQIGICAVFVSCFRSNNKPIPRVRVVHSDGTVQIVKFVGVVKAVWIVSTVKIVRDVQPYESAFNDTSELNGLNLQNEMIADTLMQDRAVVASFAVNRRQAKY